MSNLLSILMSVAWAAKDKALAIPMVHTDTVDYSAAFSSAVEARNTLYGAAALFIFREIYAFLKDKANNTGKKISEMEKTLIRIENDMEHITRYIERLQDRE